MAVTGNIVSKPISLREVAQLIGYGGNDLGRLCTHQNINKWSKHKPVIFEDLFPVGDEHFRTLNREPAQFFGMTISLGDGNSYPNNIYISSGSSFTYLTPEFNHPKRLGDFDGYNHGAEPMLATWGMAMVDGNPASEKVHIGEPSDTLIEPIRLGAYCSTSQGGITLDDVAHYIGGYEGNNQSHIALVAHFYSGSTLVASYFGSNTMSNGKRSGIKLLDTTQPSSINSFDYCDNYAVDGNKTCRWLYVDCLLDRDTFWGRGRTSLTVYLTLDYVVYNTAARRWESSRRMPIPSDTEHFFLKHIKIEAVSRWFVPSEICTNILSGSVTWSYYGSQVSRFAFVESAYLHVKCNRVPDEALTISGYNTGGRYYVIGKCNIGGTECVSHASVYDRANNNIRSTTIPAGASESSINDVVDLYLKFDNIFAGMFGQAYFEQSGQKYINLSLYLVDRDTGNETSVCSFPIRWT